MTGTLTDSEVRKPKRSWLGRLGFRARLSALSAAAVGVAILLSALASYLFVSHQLYNQVDQSLRTDAGNLSQVERPNPDGTASIDPVASQRAAEHDGDVIQIITQSGAVEATYGAQAPLKVGTSDRRVAASATNDQGQDGATSVVHDLRSGGAHYRVITVPVGQTTSGQGVAVQVAHPLNELDHTLAVLKLVLVIVALCGVALAVALGYLVARATIRPVVRLTRAAEHVAATQDLDATIAAHGDDELSRLAQSFNAMLGALGASRQQQAQLVSDAGHELRTPLTSLRTNIEVLMRVPDLPGSDREELLGDVQAQLQELTTLIGDIVELARQDERQPEPTEIRLDQVVERALDRAQRRASGLVFEVNLAPGSVRAQPALLERAILNVLDNAAKWSPPGGLIEVTLERGDRWLLDVRDHGPGIAAADLPKVFDRFYRAQTARSMPGSGLGLAIVRQVVTAHGGTVAIASPAGGGTLVHIELPIVAESEPDADWEPTTTVPGPPDPPEDDPRRAADGPAGRRDAAHPLS